MHEGQLSGVRRHLPVQLGRRPFEPANQEIQTLYASLLTTLPATAVGKGTAQVLRALPVSSEDASAKNVFVIHWQERGPEFDLAVINLAPELARCRVKPPQLESKAQGYAAFDWLGDRTQIRLFNGTANQGLLLEVPAHAAQLLHFYPAS